jgi:riboflavin kinase/FMN adenylyltransferase
MLRYAALNELRLDHAWLTIGSFDGVHLGHQALLSRLVSEAHANGGVAMALTFHPHPAVVLRGRSGPYYLTSPEERGELMHALGVDEVIIHPFDRDVAATPAAEFMRKLRLHLGLRRLFVGPDFALGRNREGDVPTLRRLGRELGYEVEIIEPVGAEGDVISSSRIRQSLAEGDVRRAAAMLGRPYALSGQVSPGDGRGRTIGIPTANLDTPPDRIVPKGGVYACRAEVAGQRHAAVANIGVRPTFSDGQPVLPRVEAHLLDFQGDLYGQTLQLEFIERLRDEQRFSGIQALVDQIHTDIHQARQILA